MISYNNIHEAYLKTLEDVYTNPDFKSSPRGLPILEKLDYSFRVLNPVAEPIITRDLERNKVIASYTNKEVELYNSRSNKATDFSKASKFWEKIANPNGTINSAYGFLIWENKSHGNSMFEREDIGIGTAPIMRTPWEWAKHNLVSDKDTRQAFLRFSLPEHQWVGNKDQTCTMHANFLIRDDKLNLTVVMRSNDLVLGLVYDMPWFVSLMDNMLTELKDTYPTLTKGHYTHMVHSMHIYEKNKDLVLKMVGRDA